MPSSRPSVDGFADIEAAARRLPPVGLDDVLRAREASAATPLPDPQLLPIVEFPYPLRHRLAGTARFGCMRGCGWFHDEVPWLEPVGPLVLPVAFTSQDVTAALTAQAEARSDALYRRVWDAITDHYGQDHPDVPVPSMPGAARTGEEG